MSTLAWLHAAAPLLADRTLHLEKSNCFDGKLMQMTRKSMPFWAADASDSFLTTLAARRRRGRGAAAGAFDAQPTSQDAHFDAMQGRRRLRG